MSSFDSFVKVQYDDIVKDKDRAYELVKADVHKQHPGLSIYEDSLRKYIFQEDGYKQTFTFNNTTHLVSQLLLMV